MSDPNNSHIFLNTEVDVIDCDVNRGKHGVTLNLRQQNGGYVAVTLPYVQAHQLGKLLVAPEIASDIIARERGTVVVGSDS